MTSQTWKKSKDIMGSQRMIVILLSLPPGSCVGRQVEVRTIHLVPVGKTEQDSLVYLSRQIEEAFPFRAKISSAFPDPDYAHDRSICQYRSDLILAKLQKLRLGGAEKILGVVDLDLYTSRLKFVFGQASMVGRVALVALPRLGQESYGLPKDQELYYSRVVKETVHELGHTLDWVSVREENA